MTAQAISQNYDLHNYDNYIVYFSGGKDSLACLLYLLDKGIDKNKIELWHHDIDGREGSELMDWKVTADYCRAISKAFDIPIYFSWKMGGFEGEMLRENSLTQPTRFETPEGIFQIGGTRGKVSTRRKFPQVSANLSVRWCSAYLKIDVGATALRNQKRFNNSRTLTVSGERAEESASRAKYKTFEPDRSDNRNGKNARHVDRLRPVHGWDEVKVWEIIERYNVNPHPAYKLGWGRVSCMYCIFGNDDQWASSYKVDPGRLQKIMEYETEFGLTIHRTKTVQERIESGEAYEMNTDDVFTANNKNYNQPAIVENWEMPAGAFGDSCGPI